MSDAMMFAIAKMPYEMAMMDEISRYQFYANTQRLAAALEAARADAERYRWLSAMATQQADYLGPIFRIHVRRSEPHLFNFDAAVDAAIAKATQETTYD